MRRDNLEGLRAGLCARAGETAPNDLSAGDNLPVPAASRTVPGDPIRKPVFLRHVIPPGRRVNAILPHARANASDH